jgi:peptidase M23-like protein
MTMGEVREEGGSTHRCAHCGGSTDLRTPHVVIDNNVVRSYCSKECAAAATGKIELAPPPPTASRDRWFKRVARITLGLPMLVFTSGHENKLSDTPVRPVETAATAAAAPDPLLFGPHWPPTDQDWMAEITSDAWVHPLDGPNRRMPISDSRVFGAERQGDRPGECRNGHCGVDLSGYWGEPVHAVHDGVVDRVQRGPNEEHGGLYVRLAHRDGSILSQYFHLAAIPRRVEVGVHIKVGEVIGLIGDTGVKHSAPHLHFTLSVRPAAGLTEKFMDPEPLIALWPIRIPVGETGGIVTARLPPGVPLGAAPRRHKSHHSVSPVDEDATAPE